MGSMWRALRNEVIAYTDFTCAHVPGYTGVRLREWYFRRRFGALGSHAVLDVGLVVIGAENVRIGREFGCMPHCMLVASGSGSIDVGDRVKLNANVHVNASIGGRITVGNDVLVGPNVVLRTSDHRFSDPDRLIRLQGHDAGTIAIEDDVWLAAHVTVLRDVRIGRGAIVAAGAVVTCDVEAGTIVGGVPARLIGRRGEPKTPAR
jgi:galactoside O-acetyltransferase